MRGKVRWLLLYIAGSGERFANAKHRGVDVEVLPYDKGNRNAASLLSMTMITEANIPIRVVCFYAVHRDKYIVEDGRHIKTGSFNCMHAARANFENVLVLWNNETAAYLIWLTGKAD